MNFNIHFSIFCKWINFVLETQLQPSDRIESNWTIKFSLTKFSQKFRLDFQFSWSLKSFSSFFSPSLQLIFILIIQFFTFPPPLAPLSRLMLHKNYESEKVSRKHEKVCWFFSLRLLLKVSSKHTTQVTSVFCNLKLNS